MKKIYYISKREFTIRIQKKSFWIMTLLGPVIMSLLMIVPLWLSMDVSTAKNIVVTDQTTELYQELPQISKYNYLYNENFSIKTDSALKWFDAEAELRLENGKYKYVSTKVDVGLEQLLEKTIDAHLLAKKGGERYQLQTTYKVDKSQGRSIQEVLAYMMGISVYFFIFMYGIQVMKGVVEEKTNRIVEVMLCTVKPFDLMMGKILGISLVGFLQFMLWVISVFVLQNVVSSSLGLEQAASVDLNQLSAVADVEMISDVQSYLVVISEMNWAMILFGFGWFFLFGFLLFASLFTVIGSASDIDTDTQQFILPITVPLLGTIILAEQIVGNPFGTLAKVLSYIPFCSPIAMSLRLPFESYDSGFVWELLGSGLLLALTFVVAVWVASRIYRIGILTYGSKIGYKELIKWFFTKE